jgi:hypothetical protein
LLSGKNIKEVASLRKEITSKFNIRENEKKNKTNASGE